MANVLSCKTFKIKPENQVAAEGLISNCKYAGSSSTGIGPFAKTTHIYKVYIEVEELEKPIVIKVKEKQGWNIGIVDDIKTMGKAFDSSLPVNIGDKVNIVYDKNKPKKCNILQ